MRAVVLREHGGPEKLIYEDDYPTPKIGDGDVLLRVRASSINYHDVFTRRGMPGIKVPLPVVVGLDVVGEIAEVGPDVNDWKIGDRVLVDPINRVEGGLMGETVDGGLAEFCRARAHQLIRIPDNVSFEQAAALPVAYGTALRMMKTIGKIKAGEKVLILGASGGVGVCCVQLAKLAGAYVIAAAGSEEKARRLEELGADETILYTRDDFLKVIYERHGKPHRRRFVEGGGVDVVVNFTGGDTWVKSLRALRLGGRLLTCGATAGYAPQEDIRFIWTFELQILGSNGWEPDDIRELFQLVGDGKLKVLIDHAYPLEQGALAVQAVEDRAVFGKVVVTP
ncbi:zinc-binding dehydrogenase [Rhodopseudomonas sp. AAP120]|uniref:zinc-binding dehydrogenase n=1 Tax=Rhodopseudomonas sp. AAP120 TaxID=1523430 RepID=UPI0006B9D225|nr:zinc-binding dehydrogenase [Rhodopseudomonas sp. AAP120]KPG01970.1 zinc-binding dehydrogenase [Rhodopseudomonas sp. AAP120]